MAAMIQTCQQRIVLFKFFAEANANIKHDVVFGNAMTQRGSA